VWMFLGTAGDYSKNANGTITYTTNPTLQGLQIYHIFGMFWISTFIIGLGEITLGKTFSTWYYAPKDKSGSLKTSQHLVAFRAFGKMTWYHAGSVAFGSFIIAVVKFIKFMVSQLEKRMKATKMHNKCIDCLFYCIKCCLNCVERFLKFISINAYIIIGIHGDISFCGAARMAFKILMSNIFLLGTVTIVTTFLLFLGKVFIMGVATAVAVWVMKADTNLNYWAIPVIIVAVLAYFIASAFFAIYGMAVNTMFLCFCYDLDQHTEGSHLTPGIKKFIESNDLQRKKKGEQKK